MFEIPAFQRLEIMDAHMRVLLDLIQSEAEDLCAAGVKFARCG